VDPAQIVITPDQYEIIQPTARIRTIEY